MLSFFIIKKAYAALVVASPPDFNQLECMVINILKYMVPVGGLGALGMVAWGGFMYITSSGDEKAMQNAQKIITYAIIGLIGIVASFFVMEFINRVILGGSVDLLRFEIKSDTSTCP